MDDRRSAEPSGATPQPHNRAAHGRPRKHMGVASSDPDYLPPVGPQPEGAAHPGPSAHARPTRPGGHSGRGDLGGPNGPDRRRSNDPLHYDRYISVPKKGRSIFTARQARQRHRLYIGFAVLVVAAVALALVWYLYLR